MTKVRKTRSAVYNIYYHIVLVPKYRKEVFQGEAGKALRSLIYKIAEEYEWWVEELEVMDDHVHMFISAPPKYSPAQIVQIMKSITAREMFRIYPSLREQYWAGEMWADGYYVGTAGHDVTKDMIKKYIKNQKQLTLRFK